MIENNLNIDWLEINAANNPDKTAVIAEQQNLTFSELNKIVDNKADYLINSGIIKGDHCAIISDNNLDFVILILSLWRIGAVPIPLNIRLTNKEFQKQIEFTECKYIFKHRACKSSFISNNSFSVLEFPFEDFGINKTKGIRNKLSYENISLILFTSGSSEKPKAVAFTFKNFYSSAVQTCKLVGAEENDSWLASLPFYHIGGFMIIIRALVKGNTLLIPNSLSINDLFYLISNFSPSFISFVSTQLAKAIKEQLNPNKKIKAVFLGGGPIDGNLILEAKALEWPVIKVYGSTETCSMVTALDLRNSSYKINSAGKEISPNSILINGTDKGEIIIESESVAKYYYEDESEKLSNSRFESNDFGYIDDEGYLFIEGRIDDIIISGGENINLNEISSALLDNSKISDAFAFGIKDDKWGQSVACAIVKNSNIDEQTVRNFLRTKIASYKIPKKIFFIESLPKTELGKVKKEELLEMLNLY